MFKLNIGWAELAKPNSNKFLQGLTLIILCSALSGCAGAIFPDVQQMLTNFAKSIPSIWRMVTGMAYLFGMAFIMRGVYQFKVYGESKGMMSSGASLKVPITYMIVGAALMFLPSTKAILLSTVYSYSEPMPLSYTASSALISPQIIQILMQIVQLVGLISFVRGWFYLAQGQQQGQSQFGKAMTHIIGGLLAINIEGTREILQATFGIGG